MRGIRVTYLPVDRDVLLKLADLENAVTDETAVVSLMWANNETGVLFPVKEIACRNRMKTEIVLKAELTLNDFPRTLARDAKPEHSCRTAETHARSRSFLLANALPAVGEATQSRWFGPGIA